MRLKKLLPFLLLLFVCFKTFPATFVVTSNADSGPGTLRDALTQAAANGSAVQDSILFNVPGNSLAERTITLLTQLPDLSSNLIIDGTSQPGYFFGVSHAKIRIINHFVFGQNLNTLFCNGGNLIEIYGLWLANDGTNNMGGLAIHFSNFGRIQIGAPLKGNLIESDLIGIDTGKTCTFQNNICYSDTLGQRPGIGSLSFLSCDSLTVGGTQAAGNMLAAIITIVFSNTVKNNLELSYNEMGTNITGTAAPYGFNLIGWVRLTILGPTLNSGQPANVPLYANIKNNIIADVYDFHLMEIAGFSGKIVIQGNAFNTDFTGTLNFNTYSQSIANYAIAYNGNADVLIGGDDPSQKNLVAYCQEGIGCEGTGKCTITRNSIFCISDMNSYIGYTGTDKIPIVKINTVAGNSITGTATPGSAVELFNADCICTTPGPKDYFATVNADDNGNWSYNGMVNGYIMASATLDSLTGFFTGLNINDSSIVIKNYTCEAKGSITGIKTQFTSGFQWYNSQNQLVGTSLELTNVDPGIYTLKINYGTTCQLTRTYSIQDYSIKVDTGNIILNKPTCGSLGSITGINVSSMSNQYFYQWEDQNNTIVCNCVDLYNVSPGFYTFMVGNADGSCHQSFGPFKLSSSNGPNINQTHALIQPTNCGQSTGSITNITATGSGTLNYAWLNSQQQTVSTDSILVSQPAGVYTLKVTDTSQCGPVYTSALTIPQTNGITLDTTNVKITIASCSGNNGSITGINTTGATLYQWVNANNNVVGTTPNLLNVGPGNYTFTASNSFGCSVTSITYTIRQQAATVFPLYNNSIGFACAGTNSGSVAVYVDSLVKGERWADSTGSTIGTGPMLSNVPSGTYQLYLTDKNGCESFYMRYSVLTIPQLTIAPGSEQITNDQCGLKQGSITGIQITGGILPYAYSWTDANNNTVSSALNLTGVGGGTFILAVTDMSGCGIVTAAYTVQEQNNDISPPSVNNLQVCGPGNAVLKVNNPSAQYGYRLYSAETGGAPVDEKASGIFNVAAKTNGVFYVSQFYGDCESTRTKVEVSVGLTSADIANTFTPNGDGINDLWNINGIDSYPNAIVQVFTRYGQKVFESKGYTSPFDGTFNGKKLPDGVYYYIINLQSSCTLISGSLTIIR